MCIFFNPCTLSLQLQSKIMGVAMKNGVVKLIFIFQFNCNRHLFDLFNFTLILQLKGKPIAEIWSEFRQSLQTCSHIGVELIWKLVMLYCAHLIGRLILISLILLFVHSCRLAPRNISNCKRCQKMFIGSGTFAICNGSIFIKNLQWIYLSDWHSFTIQNLNFFI